MNRQNRVGFFCGQDSNYFSAFTFFKEHGKERKKIEIVIHNIDDNFIKGMSVENGESVELFYHIICEIATSSFNYRYEIKYFYINKK